MKKITSYLIFNIFLLFIILGCNSDRFNKSNLEKEIQIEHSKELPDDFLGTYEGIQDSYFMKNQGGDEIIINGKKIHVPSLQFVFLIDENKNAQLKLKNLENKQIHNYDGFYNILREENDKVSLEVSLTDGQGSSPTYLLKINKSDKTGVCIDKDELTFEISKNYESKKTTKQDNSFRYIENRLPVMSFLETEHDFGTITQGTNVEDLFVFTNTGNAPLIIKDAKGSCGCTVPEYTKIPIPPGGVGEILVKYNGSGMNQRRIRVNLVTNTERGDESLTIKAFVTQ